MPGWIPTHIKYTVAQVIEQLAILKPEGWQFGPYSGCVLGQTSSSTLTGVSEWLWLEGLLVPIAGLASIESKLI